MTKTSPPLPPTLSASPFVGWLKAHNGRWRAVVGAEDYDSCWRRLLGVDRAGSHDLMVLERGKWP